MYHLSNGCLVAILCIFIASVEAQTPNKAGGLTVTKSVAHTPVKNQGSTGTCWSFSTTSLIESQAIRNGGAVLDLSEMFTVRSIYMEKAKNYILRQGKAQFGPGGLGHDVIHSMAMYGAMPESAFPGLALGETQHNHEAMDAKLKQYMDSLLGFRPVPHNWMKGFESILNDHLGKPPETFLYGEKQYTPKSFAAEVLHFHPDDYIAITSFTHHPFYSPFVLEVPDNFENGSYYNVPIEEMIGLTEKAVLQGYSVMWDADISNKFFKQREGYAMQWKDTVNAGKTVSADDAEIRVNQNLRQDLYEELTTQDDHLMHIVGIEKSPKGKKFFLVKNSWGEVGQAKGMIHVSEAYFAVNTISLILPKAAIDKSLLAKLNLNN